MLELFKVFNFLDKIPGFSKTLKLCLNFCIGFWITYLVLPNYKKISVHKTLLYINHANHLNDIQPQFNLYSSDLSCIQSHLIYIQSQLIHIRSPHLYSVILYILRNLIFARSLLICTESHLVYIKSNFNFIQSSFFIQSHILRGRTLCREKITRLIIVRKIWIHNSKSSFYRLDLNFSDSLATLKGRGIRN